MKGLVYPVSFPARPEDRLFLRLLEDAGVPEIQAELILHRIWRDFGSGGSDRRELKLPLDLATDPQGLLLEASSGFTGQPGYMVGLGIRSGFFLKEESPDGRPYLVCKDFFPLNAPAGGSGSARGAYERSRKNQREKARVDTAEHLKLWKSTGVSVEGMTPEQQEQAMVFLYSVTRALHPLAMPADETLRRPGGLVEQAWAILHTHAEDDIAATQRWLITMRRDPALKKDLADIVARWAELEERAKRVNA